MKFYNREKEMQLFKRLERSKGLKFIVIKGLRRIGKTRLILEFLKNKKSVYIFVPKGKTVSLFLEDICSELNMPRFTRLLDFFRYAFDNNEYVFFDEFQNFYFMDKSIYSEIQKLVDEYSNKEKNITVFVTGSSYSLMKKIFSDYSKALYGRRDLEIILKEFDIATVIQILNEMKIKNIEDQIKFWSIFGGVPKFYSIIEKLDIHSFSEFEKLFKNYLRMFFEEGNAILISEFGGDYKIFFSILEAVASGSTKLSEIASVFGSDVIKTNRYMSILRKEYNLLTRATPTLSRKKTRNTIYMLKNNYLDFWFVFLKKKEILLEQDRFEDLVKNFSTNFNKFLGKKFEKFCLEAVKNSLISLPFSPEITGPQWGKFKGEKGKNTYEIDIIALNEKTKQILFAECKWKDKVNTEKVLRELKEKAKYVDWYNDKRKEYYAIFAKSFSKRIKDKNVFLFDLGDMKKIFKKKNK
ncbi:MAG: ATP-binding protein [Candidatus Aenigmarchaeota archaeon]|nr:ATP-binding protein [Candidatus Aenigmarchaeota archaeon]